MVYSKQVKEADDADSEPATTLENMKHPLEHTWIFWLYTNKSKNWEKNLVQLSKFNAVEDYWCLYHHMKTPSELRLGQDYMIFKEGIRPMWEDASNKLGGRLLINGLRNATVDQVWLDTVLMVIGENFMNSDIINGVFVNVRAESKVCVWTRKTNQEENTEIGRKLKHQLGIKSALLYQPHKKNCAFTV